MGGGTGGREGDGLFLLDFCIAKFELSGRRVQRFGKREREREREGEGGWRVGVGEGESQTEVPRVSAMACRLGMHSIHFKLRG